MFIMCTGFAARFFIIAISDWFRQIPKLRNTLFRPVYFHCLSFCTFVYDNEYHLRWQTDLPPAPIEDAFIYSLAPIAAGLT